MAAGVADTRAQYNSRTMEVDIHRACNFVFRHTTEPANRANHTGIIDKQNFGSIGPRQGIRDPCLQIGSITTLLQLRKITFDFSHITGRIRSEEHTSEPPVTNAHLVCRLLHEQKKLLTSHPTNHHYIYHIDTTNQRKTKTTD